LKRRLILAATVLIVIVTVTLLICLGNNQTASRNPNDSTLLPEVTTYTTQNGVRYQNDTNPYHLLDAYLPDGDGPFPAIIYIHGGGWVQGNRSDFAVTAALYAKCGIAGFSIDYTLAPVNGTAWPQNIKDVMAAVEFVRENAAFYNVDIEKIALMGNSAGGHLASLVGTLSGSESFLSMPPMQEPIKNHVCLVISYGGVTDLEYIGEHHDPSLIYKIVTFAFGNVSYLQNPSLWKEASPATYVSSDDPPFVFVHGSNDAVVPIDVAESFNTKLQNAGVETHFIQEDEASHDILTSAEWNLQARYQLDPLLAKVFNLN
jgi:acetyl esterase/lipase